MSDRETTWFQEQVRELDRPVESDEARLARVREIAHLCRLRVERHDPYTKEHSVRVAMWSKVIASRLPTFDKERLTRLEITALVHDYGKIDVPAEILNKDGCLTPEEYDEVKKHPELGAARLGRFRDYISVEGVLYHHLRYEGGGYPDGAHFSGNQIPIEARIIAVGDTFDALTSDRSYRKGLEPARAVEVMRGIAGRQLDPTLFRIFATYYQAESVAKGYEVGAQTMMLSASVDEEVRRAREFLRKAVGDFDRADPLAKVTDKEAFVRAAIDHLVSLAVDADMAEKFVRYAYRLPQKDTIDREDIALSDNEIEALRSRHDVLRRHREIALPLRRMRQEYRSLQIAVFDGKLWKCVGDGNCMLLLQ